MKEVNRRRNAAESIWNLCFLIYMIFVFPCALLISVASIFMGPSSLIDGDFLSSLFLLATWMGVILPLLYLGVRRKYRSNKMRKIVALLSNKDRFNPSKEHQIFNIQNDKYLGIDSKRGTILYIHVVKKGVVDVIGLTMRDWTDREVEGGALRLNTRDPDMPVLSLYTNQSKAIFDLLGAMSHNSYSEPFPKEPWAEYVGRQSRFVEFEHDVVVPQVI